MGGRAHARGTSATCALLHRHPPALIEALVFGAWAEGSSGRLGGRRQARAGLDIEGVHVAQGRITALGGPSGLPRLHPTKETSGGLGLLSTVNNFDS
jgi:hypothetical protein